jgi:large subunit ribosomal protein L10
VNTQQKEEVVERLHETFLKTRSMVMVHYRGLNVEEINQLRRKCREANLEFRVVKNTLARRALKNTPHEGAAGYFKGPVSVALGFEDQTAPAKVLKEFMRTRKDKVALVGACVEGKVLNAEETQAFADLPSREVLLSRLLSAMQGPIRNFVSVLNGPIRQFVGVLEAIRAAKEKES